MHIREELQISKPLESGHEVGLALLLGREYVVRSSTRASTSPRASATSNTTCCASSRGGRRMATW